MGSSYQVEVVLLQEDAHYVWTEDEADSSVVLLPTVHVLLWVGPEQIAEQSCVWNVSWPHNSSDLLHVAEFRR